MNKKLIPLGLIALAGIGAITLLVLLKPKPQPAPLSIEKANVKVAVAPVEFQTVQLSVTAQGTVTPTREIDVIAEVSGRITSVEPVFEDGAFFNESQILLNIDASDYLSAVLNAKARVAEAQYRLSEEQGLSRQARREWRDLGNENANELFLRKPQLAAAKANLDSARGDLGKAQADLDSTRISVPFGGRIKETFVDLGEYVTEGTKLATVFDSSQVEIRLPLTEAQAALLDLPFSPRPLERQSLVTVRGSVAGESYEWNGVLARTDAYIDANSRMYVAVVEVEQPFSTGVPLLPGLFVDAEIEGKHMHNVVKLPRGALYQRDKLLMLDSDNKVSEKKVRVLRRTADFVWVKADIPEQTLIALEKQSLTPAGSIVDPLLAESSNQPVAADVQPTQEVVLSDKE
ncbi:RND family efflux transporter MFP subunit [Alteromonadaceae bacterium 2753L.S.0a.02]|nr:RND family efflux transporter MFP subunit [Alteromonadaceae bacterium 2753L.S.0a.02]